MRLVPFALVASIVAAGCAGCAGSRPVPPEPAPAEDEPAAPAVLAADPAPEALAEDPPAPEAAEPQPGLALPPPGDPAWVAPEIRTLAEALGSAALPPTAVYYVGGSHAGGCLELYTFRFYYGAKDRWAEVAGFETLDHAEDCLQIVQAAGRAVPERIGVFLIDFAPALAAEPALRAAFVDAVGNLPVGTATEIPRNVEPYGAEPGAVVRHRHPRPAG